MVDNRTCKIMNLITTLIRKWTGVTRMHNMITWTVRNFHLNTWNAFVVMNFQKSPLIVKLVERLFVKTAFISCQEKRGFVHAAKRNSLWDLRLTCAWVKSSTNLKSYVLLNVVKESKKVTCKCMLTNIVPKSFSSVQNAEKRWKKTSSNIIFQENIKIQCLTNFWNRIMRYNNNLLED